MNETLNASMGYERSRGVVMDRLVSRLEESGLRSAWYTIPGFEGFASLTGGRAVDVHCVEARLGPAPGLPGYSSYAVAETFLPEYPTLAITFLVELADADRRPAQRRARFDRVVDRSFSLGFLPAMFSGLNELDPTGTSRGLLVQSYNAEVTLPDFLHAIVYTLWLLTQYKRSGQLALIAVDYYDPLSRFLAKALRGMRSRLPDLHLIPKKDTLSGLKLPLRGPDGGYHFVDGSSNALDDGIALARSYLDAHYRRAQETA